MAAAASAAMSSCALLPPAPPAHHYIGSAPTSPQAPEPAEPVIAQPGAETQPAEPLAVTVDEAILLALGRNRALSVQLLNPAIGRTFEQQERAVFDLDVSAEAGYSRQRAPQTAGGRATTGDAAVAAEVSQLLPTGTDVSLSATGDLLTSTLRSDQYVNRLGLSVNQALLRGAGLDVNLARVRQARLDTLASEYELRGFAEALAAAVEQTYWDYALAQRAIKIVTNSLALAQQQIDEVRQRVLVGSLAETEMAAAEAQVALRREDLINARSLAATTRLQLLRLLNPNAADLGTREVVLKTVPSAPQVALDDVDVYVQVAQRLRPDLNQARLGVQRGDLELVRTRNGLLPRLDFFVTLGTSGYSDSFGGSAGRLTGHDYDLLAGLKFEFPPANRDAQARHQRASYSREQALRAVENLGQLVEVDVRTAYIEVGRAGEQVTATAATRRLREETLRVETEKFRVGKSTSFLVAQAQRDLLESQINEVRAVAAHLKAIVALQLQEGALLERRGITAPGSEPVNLPAPRR